MTKNEMISAIAENTGLTKKDVGAVIDTLTGVVTDALVAGDKVTLPGLCTFETVDVKEKTGIIQMGEKKGQQYITPAHRAPRLKAASSLKQAVKGL